jgi:hypothetical protein
MLNCEKSCRLIVFWCNFPSVYCALRTKALLLEIRETKNPVQNVWQNHAWPAHASGADRSSAPGSVDLGPSAGAWCGKMHVYLRVALLRYKRAQSLCHLSSKGLFHKAVPGLGGASSARRLRFWAWCAQFFPGFLRVPAKPHRAPGQRVPLAAVELCFLTAQCNAPIQKGPDLRRPGPLLFG